MGSKSLPVRPQWYRDMIAKLRAQRKRAEIPAHEFLELAADEAVDHRDYVRSLVLADIAGYDRKVAAEQRATLTDDIATAEAMKFLQGSLYPTEMLEKLGLDADLELGFGRKVSTLDATPADRQTAIGQLEKKRANSNGGIDRQIAAIEQLDDLAGGRTLREIIDDRPDEEYGAL